MTADPFDLAARFASPGDQSATAAPGEGEGDPEERSPDEAAYVCDSCGEEIVVPVDPAAGARQEYVEDCPVCCRPNVLTVHLGPQGEIRCEARPE